MQTGVFDTSVPFGELEEAHLSKDEKDEKGVKKEMAIADKYELLDAKDARGRLIKRIEKEFETKLKTIESCISANDEVMNSLKKHEELMYFQPFHLLHLATSTFLTVGKESIPCTQQVPSSSERVLQKPDNANGPDSMGRRGPLQIQTSNIKFKYLVLLTTIEYICAPIQPSTQCLS